MQCPTDPERGRPCTTQDETVDTTNPNQPAHVNTGECFDCPSNRVGVDWTCVDGRWQASAILSCAR
jgi:hypothetical protein